MSEVIYFHIWDGHFKMWSWETFHNDDGTVDLILSWGRIKNSFQKLQHKVKKFPSPTASYCYIQSTAAVKAAKGYVAIPSKDYGQYEMGEISLGELTARINAYDEGMGNRR